MKITRNCPAGELNTGVSGCPIDFKHIVAAIVMTKGQKLPASIDASTLEEACHAARPDRIMPFKNFVEYAKNGGESQVSAMGYGPSQYTGVSEQQDTFSLPKFIPELHAAVLKAANLEFGVYYVDKDNNIIGLNDGTDILAPIPVLISSNIVPWKTSGNQSTQTVTFYYIDTEYAHKHYDYFNAGFNVPDALVGLVPVEITASETAGHYKIVEHIGGYDRTAEFDVTEIADCFTSEDTITAVTYNDEDNTFSVTGADDFKLAEPSVLYASGVVGMMGYEE